MSTNQPEDNPTIAQMEAGAQALRECNTGAALDTRESRMATADSVWRAMQEVRVAQSAGDAVLTQHDMQVQWGRIVRACIDSMPPGHMALYAAAEHPCGNPLPVAVLALTERIAEADNRISTDGRLVAHLEAELVEERNRIASMRTECGAEVAALTARLEDANAVAKHNDVVRSANYAYQLGERQRLEARIAELEIELTQERFTHMGQAALESVVATQRPRIAELEADAIGRQGVLVAWISQALLTLETIDPDDTEDCEALQRLIDAGARFVLERARTPVVAPAVDMGGAGVTVTLAQPAAVDWSDAPAPVAAPSIDAAALAPAAETFMYAAPSVADLLRQARELADMTRDQPGKAVQIPPLLETEGRKFMRGEPSLFDQMTIMDAETATGSLNACAPRDTAAMLESLMAAVADYGTACAAEGLSEHRRGHESQAGYPEYDLPAMLSEIEASARKLAGGA